MAQNPPAQTQRVIPYLTYADAPAAIEFLCDVFGFEERFRIPMDDGQIGHCELGFDDNVLMLASVFEGQGHASRRDLPAYHSMVMVYVDDVDAHYAQAQAAGAIIKRELQDMPYGDRVYHAEDPEGQQWVFATHVEDVDFSALGSGESS